MALSDICFEFLQTVSSAAEELARGVHHYSDPGYPLHYGSEIDALRRASVAVREAPYDPEAGARLLRLATSIMAFHDTLPDTDQSRPRHATGLDPVVHAEHERSKPTDHCAMSSHKSHQSGFIERIRSIFHERDQCLIFFSRWIAAIAVACCS